MTSEGVWKHIGLHGHSVGTFGCDEAGIQWTSALFGKNDSTVVASTRNVPKEAIVKASWSVFGKSGHIRIQTQPNSKLHHELRFDGFPPADFEKVRDIFKDKYSIDLNKLGMSAAGTQFGLSKMSGKKLTFRHCILEDADEEGEEFEVRKGDEMMSLDLAEVSQCVLPGNNRNEIELQFPESDAVEANNDQLVSIRFYIPPDPENDPSDRTVKTPAELLQQRIMSTASIRKTSGDVIVEFEHDKGSFLTPRGRYAIELYEHFFRMRGQKYDYKIKYDDISRLFLLPKPDEVHMAFVIALDRPIRQGQQRYQHLVLQTSKDPDEVVVNLDEAQIKKTYGDDLQPVMRGSLSNLVAKTFKVIAKKKVFIPGKFANANQQHCVKCALRANEGLLYPLEKQFVFIHKPPILIRFNEVESVEFQRYAGGQGSTRNFDLCVRLKASAAMGGTAQEYTFSGIDRSDYAGLYNFLSGKNIKIKNLQDTGVEIATAPVYNEDEIYGGPDNDPDLEESEDESYDEKAAAEERAEESGSESEDIDDDELGSEIDDELDSDLEEARDPKKRKKTVESEDELDEDDVPQKKKKKQKKAAAKETSTKTTKKTKKKKDPKAPKKPLTSYMIYVSENRARVKKENPDASFGELGKLVAAEFRGLTPDEKKIYEEKAGKDKKRYKKEMESYVPPDDDDDDDGGGVVPKKKKAKKDPNAPKRAQTNFMFFSNENRAKVKADNPEATFGQIGKLIGEKFRGLTAEEKEVYNEKAAKDKKRYAKEMQAYTAKQKADQDESDGMNDDQDSDDSDSD